ncbi:MAG TPA: hypothetical protein VGA02_03215 [Gemmatimonadales bacterium]
MTTAEWKCVKCGVTNRKLVPKGTTSAPDKCVTCRTPHVVTPGARPAFWEAVVKT